MGKIKAIETSYKGYRFRSRLEARVAVFFDELRWSYEYEPEGFALEFGGAYLPDFLLTPPDSKPVWIEVKGSSPSGVEVNKLRELCCTTGKHGFFITSRTMQALADPADGLLERHRLSFFEAIIAEPYGHQVPHSRFLPWRTQEERAEQGWPEVDPGEAFKDELRDLWLYTKVFPSVSREKFVPAAQRALAARFEHGETPDKPVVEEEGSLLLRYRDQSPTFEEVIPLVEDALNTEPPAERNRRLLEIALASGIRTDGLLRMYLASR